MTGSQKRLFPPRANIHNGTTVNKNIRCHFFATHLHYFIRTTHPSAENMATVVARLNENDPTLERVSLESTKDFHYGELSKALRKSNCVKSFHINEGIFTVEEFKSPTWRHLRQLLQSVTYMRGLEELHLRGNMALDNMHDVKVIAKSICKHPELRDVRLLDFVVHARDGGDADPLLEPLVTAASSIPTLQALDIQCQASFREWNRSYISTSSLAPMCQSTILQRLALSNVGLEDEHFLTIARELMDNKDSVLKELVLSNNNHTVVGTEAMLELLDGNNFLERLEMHNHNRIDDAIAKRMLDCVERNHLVKHLNANIRCVLYRTEINFLLLLNRAGRKKLLNPDVMPTEAVDVLAAANGNISVLMHFLRENPALCRDPAKSFKKNGSKEAQMYELESFSRPVKEKERAGDAVVVEEESTDEQVVESLVKDNTIAAAENENENVSVLIQHENPALCKDPIKASQKKVRKEAQMSEAESLLRPVKEDEVAGGAIAGEEENTDDQIVEEKQENIVAKDDTIATTGALQTSEGASTVVDRNDSEVVTKTTTGELYSIFKGMADDSVLVWRRFWYRSSFPGDASEEA